MPAVSSHSFEDFREVFLLFTIPVGGGIPGGVLLAKTRGISWPWMTVLYFLSDLLLAIAFEPVLRLFVGLGSRVQQIRKLTELFKRSMSQGVAKYSHVTSPVGLVLVAFGVDPMTGRAAALAAGHGFLTGWMIAIAGDMMYFTVLMTSTLWLHQWVGDGTVVMLIVLGMMMIIGGIKRRPIKGKV